MKALFYFVIFVVLALPGCRKEYSCESCNQPTVPPVSPPPPVVEPDPAPEPPPQPPNPKENVFAGFLLDAESVYLFNDRVNIDVKNGPWTNGPSYCINDMVIVGLGNDMEQPYFSMMKNGSALTSMEAAKSFFARGEYVFSALLTDPVACCPCRDFSDGVALNYIDSAGTFWATYLGVQPADAGLNITIQQEYQSKLYVEGGFGGAFYNEQGERKLMYGTFRLLVWNQ